MRVTGAANSRRTGAYSSRWCTCTAHDTLARIATGFGISAGGSRARYSAKHRRHGVNVQVVTDPIGEIPWIPPVLSGRAHDLTAARTHKIIRIWRD